MLSTDDDDEDIKRLETSLKRCAIVVSKLPRKISSQLELIFDVINHIEGAEERQQLVKNV